MTINDVIVFRINGTQYNEYCKRNYKWTKFNYAIEKMISRTNEIIKRYNEQLEDKRIDLASVDDRGNLIFEKNELTFTSQKYKELVAWIRAKQLEDVTVEPYLSEPPDDLSESLREIFKGFVL